MSSGHRNDDLISLALRFVKPAEDGDEKWCELPTDLARAIIEMAKRAPRSGSGRPPVPGRVQIQDIMTVHGARRHKAVLLAQAKAEGRPLTASAAEEQAAEKASQKSRLSAGEIRQRMQRRSRR